MIKLSLILLLFPLLLFSQVTKNGINFYVKTNSTKIICEFEEFFNVKIDRDLDFEVVDILEYSNDSNEVGKCIPEYDLIVISNNQNKYKSYSAKDINPKDQNSSYIFVKSVILHELCHIYIRDVIDSLKVKDNFNFIEEGICEYAVTKMGELAGGDLYIPKNMKDLNDNVHFYDIKYEYSAVFVKPILDKYGFKLGTILLLKTKSPTDKELLNPELYYKRIKIF